MDNLQQAPESSRTTPPENLEKNTQDQMGGQTHKHLRSGGSQNAQHHHLNNAASTPMDRPSRPRAPGGQKKRFKDNIKTTLNKFLITSQDWEHMALNRHCWRAAVQEGAAHHEKELRRVAETKRQLRKERQKQAPARPQPTTTFPCPHCTKICGSRIGLYAHLRTHK